MKNTSKEIQSIKELITSKDPNNVSLAFLLSQNYEKQIQDELFYHFLEIYTDSKEDWTSRKYLYLDNCELQEIPASIGNLTSLESLDLDDNQIQELPDSIGNLVSLEELDLDYNQLQKLPESIGNLTSLKTLYIQGNPIPKKEQNKIKKLLPNCKIYF